jgi:hypothetical protein
MADKTPVRVVFNASNVATGMAEFQSGDTVPVANGGTGLSALGSAGQLLKVNAAGNALEFASDGDFTITNLLAPSNADLTLRTSGTGGIILNDITISDNSISTNRSNDDFKINASGTGTVVLENLKVGTSGSTVTTILDEDNMSSNSATSLATQQSIKAYVDSEVGAVSTTAISQGNSNVTVVDAGTGNVTIEVDGTDRITTVAATTTTATGHSLVIGAGSNSAAGQIKFLEGTDNGTNGVTLIGPASTADVTVTLPAATDTLVGKATTDTFTNKTFDVEATGNSISNIDVADLKSGVLDTDLSSVSGSDDTLASAKAIKSYVDTQITAEDLDIAADDSTAIAIDLDSEVLQISGGAGITTSATGNTITISLDTALTVNSLVSGDSSSINVKDGLDIDGTLTLASGTGVNNILDEDAMGSDSATALATQQSIKAYVDAQDANIAGDTLTFTNKTIDANGTGNNISNIDIGNMTAAVVVLESEGISSNDNDTTLPTSAAVKDYADTKAVLSGSTDNQITTVTGAHAIQGESNLTFDGTTLAVTGAATISTTLGVTGASTLDGVTITDNTISTNASNAPLELKANGTGAVIVTTGGVALTLPTADGTDGQALVTNGSGTLSFGTVGAAPVSDDSAASVVNDKMITSTARTIDSFQTTFQDSVLYYVVSNDFNEDAINVQKVSVCHNDSASFISSAGAQSKASTTMTAFTTSVDNSVVRVKAASSNAVGGSLSFYKFGLGDNTSTGTSNNVIISQNTDVDSASESLFTFAHADFRGAKLFISINNNSKTEVGNVEALVVHDGSAAFISQFGGIQSGDNPLLTLTAAISGDNVVVSAAGLETNLRVTVHAIMLKDTMTSNDGSFSNAEAIAPVTISSSATAVDELVETTANGAVYYLVSKNASEGEFAVNEVFFAMGGGDITVASGPFVSTKGTNQLNFTADYKDDVENTGRLLASSTSGGSTTVSAYRINALAK